MQEQPQRIFSIFQKNSPFKQNKRKSYQGASQLSLQAEVISTRDKEIPELFLQRMDYFTAGNKGS